MPESAPDGTAPKIVLREADLKQIRDQLKVAAKAEEKPPSLMLSQAVSLPVDLEVSLEALSNDDLALVNHELQDAGLDLDQLVSVLASDDPLKLEPEVSATGDGESDEAAAAVVMAEATAAGESETAVETLEMVTAEGAASSLLFEEDARFGSEKGFGSDMGETASTADVESSSDCAASTAGDCAASDAGTESDGCSTPHVPPSPLLLSSLALVSPPSQRAGERSGGWTETEKESEEAAAAASDVSDVNGAASSSDAEAPSPPLEGVGAEVAFDKAELLELLLGHVTNSMTPSLHAQTSSSTDVPAMELSASSAEEGRGKGGSKRRTAADKGDKAAEVSPNKRRRSGTAAAKAPKAKA